MNRTCRRITPAFAGALIALAWGAMGPVHGGATTIAVASPAAADVALASLGINPATVLHQVGRDNYAGPSCPSAASTCATFSRAVVQQSAAGGSNTADCSQAGTECYVFQYTSGGTNSVSCGTSNGQLCTITQSNTTGANRAAFAQITDQDTGNTRDGDGDSGPGSASDSQTSTQTGSITQTNGSGPNAATAVQVVDQYINDGAASQAQQAVQTVCVQQDSTGGANSATVVQSQTQRAVSSAAGASQQQNASAITPPACGSSTAQSRSGQANQSATVLQDQGGGESGSNTILMRQGISQLADATSATGVAQQTQSSVGGGLFAAESQGGSGTANLDKTQDEHQVERNASGAATDRQHGPMGGHDVQSGSPVGTAANTVQTAVQSAPTAPPPSTVATATSAPGAPPVAGGTTLQTEDVYETCQSTGHCNNQQSVTQNGHTTTNSCTGNGSCSPTITCGDFIDAAVDSQVPPGTLPSCFVGSIPGGGLRT